jgi:putative ubiquitin-RnfH superfamily antitoxin RatB of RatAB toxin-antitoxin module
MKNCTVVFAMPERQWLWQVTLPDNGTVGEALDQARERARENLPELDVPWDADVGIFGELCSRAAVPRDGDRIELYRTLKSDPKESRRERARERKAAPDRVSSRSK